MRDLNQLIEILQKEFSLYSQLHQVLQEEHQYLKESKIDDLKLSVDAKYKFLRRIAELEKDRSVLCKRISYQFGEADTSLKTIAEYLPESDKKALLEWRSFFASQLESIEEQNQANEVLARSALLHIENSLDVMKDALHSTDTYQQKGSKRKKEQVEHLFSKKA